MKHLGDIAQIKGALIDPVDIITFGAPCQDLSVAGKRSGMKHEVLGDNETTRSGLFFEAIRIIKEMRESTNGEYPKYAVYENVPGAFSSNKGRDFHAVLEALCSVCDDSVSIPEPYDKKRTKLVWNKAGELVGDNYSVAWRTLDAQYWGVPQRRKRIYLVADFTGRCAGEILFKPEGLRGDLSQGNEAGQEVTADAVGSVNGSVGVVGIDRAIPINDKATRFSGGGNTRKNDGAGNGMGVGSEDDPSPTVTAADRHAVCYDARGNGDGETLCFNEAQITSPTNGNEPQWNEPCHTLSATDNRAPTVIINKPPRKYIIRRLTPTECARLQGFPDWWGRLPTIKDMDDKDYEFWCEVLLTKAKMEQTARWDESKECYVVWQLVKPDKAKDECFEPYWRDTGNPYKDKTNKQMVRWYDKLHTDSAEYKAYGNGLALPNAEFVMMGIAQQGAKTLGSLFDGIGGFPLAGAMNGIKPLWASEIEAFPIAVTKYWFPEAVPSQAELNARLNALLGLGVG